MLHVRTSALDATQARNLPRLTLEDLKDLEVFGSSSSHLNFLSFAEVSAQSCSLRTMSSLREPLGLLKALLVRIPLILKTILLHGVQMSPVKGKQDMRTELTVAIIRSFITTKAPLGKVQKQGMRDSGVKGPMWVSKVTLPRPDVDVRDAVLHAIEDLKTGDETYDIPAPIAVEAEWTGYRAGVGKKTPEPDLSEEEKYNKLREESPSDMTILYFHGGAYL